MESSLRHHFHPSRPVLHQLLFRFVAVPALLLSLARAGTAQVAPADDARPVRFLVRHEQAPVEGAILRRILAPDSGAGNSDTSSRRGPDAELIAITDDRGQAELRLGAGRHAVVATRIGFAPETVLVTVGAEVRTDDFVLVEMETLAAELQEVVVTSTRTGRRVEDEPVRVEVLAREEIEEKLLMTPGDITMMLNETSGLRVQTTSPSLGGAGVRVQGLRGRYTQLLSDGLPLYGGQTGSLGLLQVPPMDLGQVEVIKGAASALYGASALGGVINLISRRATRAREVLVNQTSRGGTDLVAYVADSSGGGWAYSALAGAHRQRVPDVDGDGWADIAGYERGVLRPRVFWTDTRGTTVFLTAGATIEDRDGGTIEGAAAPDGAPFPEGLRTRRYDAGGVVRVLRGTSLLSARASATTQDHAHRFGPVRERDRHRTLFAEASWTRSADRHTTVVGAAVQHDRYDATDVPGFDYRFTIPGLFAQLEYAPAEWLAMSGSARLDAHSEYGVAWSPRLSALLRGGEWTVRLSAGGGFFGPTPFTEETEVVGLRRVVPLDGLREERAWGGSIDVGRLVGPLELNATLFGSEIQRPIATREVPDDRLALVNAAGPTRTVGGELLARLESEPFAVTASYALVRSTELDVESGARRAVPLTARHSASLVAVAEAHETGRVGLELYFTGPQELEDNPYRDRSPAYVVLGLLAERRLGRVRLFVNGENLLGVRQTEYDPLPLPARGRAGRWTSDVWGPLEGRTVNGGVRLEL